MRILDIEIWKKKISLCKSLEDIKPECQDFCTSLGWEYYLFGVVDATSLSSPKITTITNYPEGWWCFYFKEEMQKCDPVVRYCFDKSTPIRWDKLMEIEEYVSPEAEKMMTKAATFGLANGFSIPIKSPSGEVAIFSLATPHLESIDERYNHALHYAQTLSYTLLEAYLRLKAETETNFRITPRERECLFWACEGKTAWEISKIIEVSERTVIFHMTSATKKLGAANRQHAVAKAILHGLIKPVP